MDHLTEEELVLHYYGEAGDSLSAERHLEDCPECREALAALERVLQKLEALPAPEPGPDYGARVWRQIAPAIAGRRRGIAAWLPRLEWRWAAACAVMASLLVAAFLAG